MAASATSAKAPSLVVQVFSWCLLAALVVLGAAQLGMAWREITYSGMDLQQDYVAGQRLRYGGDIYTRITPEEIAALGGDDARQVGMRWNAHPPATALLFAPLTLLPFSIVALLWTLATAVLLFIVLRVLARKLELPIRGVWLWIAVLFSLEWYPVWYHMHLGQFTVLILVLVVAAWLCEGRGRVLLAGSLLGFAALLKVYPVLLLGIALLRGRWRVFVAGLTTMLALVAVQAAWAPRHWIDYVTRVAPANAAEWMAHSRNVSLVSVSLRLFAGTHDVRPFFAWPQAELPVRIALYAAACLCLVGALWRSRHGLDLCGDYALGLSAMALLSPLSWDHAQILLLLPFAYVWGEAQRMHRRLPRTFVTLALSLSLFPGTIVFSAIKNGYGAARMPALVHLHATGVLSLMLGFAAIVWVRWRARANSTA